MITIDRHRFIASCLALSALAWVGCGGQVGTPAEDAGAPESASHGSPTGSQPAPAATPAADTRTAAAESSAATTQRRTAVAEPPRPKTVSVGLPAGTEIEIELADLVSSGTSLVGDPVHGRLTQDLVADGTLVAAAGSDVSGVVTSVVPLKKFGGQPSVAMIFDTLTLADGTTASISAPFTALGAKQAGRDAAKIGGAAAAGAILGHQVDDKKGSEVGAVIGGAIGTAVAAKTGKEVDLPVGTILSTALDTGVQAKLRR